MTERNETAYRHLNIERNWPQVFESGNIFHWKINWLGLPAKSMLKSLDKSYNLTR